jgi:heat-inducible transcriptional repressor
MDLDERKATILRAVVEEYIETAQPVGSGHVAQAPGVTVSSATIRNDMAILEQEGYLAQPHTSAGRVPTEKGYRFFVDGLDVPGQLAGADAHVVRTFFSQAHGELEQMLQDTSRLLAGLTHYAAVVVGPPHEAATVRSVQLVELTPRIALLVLVLSNGVVEKRTLEFDDDVDAAALTEAAASLAAGLMGQTLAAVAASPPTAPGAGPEPQPGPGQRKGKDQDGRDGQDGQDHARVFTAAVDALTPDEHHDEHVFIRGASRMASAFDAVKQVSDILQILEQQYVVVTLLRDVLDRGLNVAIGTETGMLPLSECSLIVSPYAVDGEMAGSVGVLGPTRMNYPQALAAVAVVSQRLGHRLSEG